ncbi:hypothetical protein PR202_ga12139 [Eleusine coracana subsp. coracana]|uniref:Gnk2-homologous domain-containing protein n=1 Tax=Eleusine coracana subsp. coracana TaxID=191504 RepID=A0AAV5CBF4_ELECO|nr:hypothetical protein PR202_ga12139 [Eleusine coracana subsp. coracana]
MALTIPRHLTPPYLLTPVAVTILGLALILHVHLATAQTTPLPWLVCNTTVNYTEKSAYQANLHRLATTLPSNASSSPALFAVDAAGTVVPDTVYALALCRGDTNDTSACSSCVTNAFRNARRLCALNKGATLYADACILRYADWDFLTNTTSDDDNSQPYVASSHRNVSAAKAAAFDAASARLINATAELAAADPVKRFGTGEESFDETYYPVIYSLAQCTPDMSAADCRACLGDMIRAVTPKYFAGKEGGRAFGVRCNFRFQTFPFFHGNPMLQILQAPPMPPANMNPLGTSEGRALAIAVPTVVLTLALACFCFSSMRIERRKGSIMPSSGETGHTTQAS